MKMESHRIASPRALALTLVVLLAAACAPTRQPVTSSGGGADAVPIAQEPQRQPRTVVISVNREPLTLGPVSPAGSGFSTNFAVRPFSGFLELVDDRGVPRPYLAETLPRLNTDSWKVFPDGRMETRYLLLPKLAWHDGVPFSAEDFVFAWRAYTTPELAFATASTVPLSAIEEVLAPDARTLVIRWKRVYPGAGNLQVGGVSNLGLPPLPRHILESPSRNEPESFGNLPHWRTEFVGLGPYKLDRWEQGTFLEGVAFEGHALGRPKIDRLRVAFIGDTNTVMANMRTGSIHLATEQSLTFDQALELKREWATNREGTFLWTAASMRAFEFQFRPDVVTPRALLDVRVRQALAHSLDKTALSEAMWGGEGILLDAFFSPRVEYYPRIDQAIAKYPYDLSATERLMAQASYAKGADGAYVSPTDGRLVIEVQASGSAIGEQERSIGASLWRQAGFDMQEKTVPLALQGDGQTRATFAGIVGNAHNATETSMSSAFTTDQIARPENRWNGNNRGGWTNPDYDRAFEIFNNRLDPNERTVGRVDMGRIVSQDLPGIMLYFHLNPTPHLASLANLTLTGPDTTVFTAWNVHEWELR